jgi:hypothetical protein
VVAPEVQAVVVTAKMLAPQAKMELQTQEAAAVAVGQ